MTEPSFYHRYLEKTFPWLLVGSKLGWDSRLRVKVSIQRFDLWTKWWINVTVSSACPSLGHFLRHDQMQVNAGSCEQGRNLRNIIYVFSTSAPTPFSTTSFDAGGSAPNEGWFHMPMRWVSHLMGRYRTHWLFCSRCLLQKGVGNLFLLTPICNICSACMIGQPYQFQ